MNPSIVIVGNPEEYHIGAHLSGAASSLGWKSIVCDVRQAWSCNALRRRINYHILGKRPPRLHEFSRQVVDQCRAVRANYLLITGVVPLASEALAYLRGQGVRLCIFLTDDPWNAANSVKSFWATLPLYDLVCTPRRVNKRQLQEAGASSVSYVPFGYNPEYHFQESASLGDDQGLYSCDVAFIGGADGERIDMACELVRAGLHVRLYGDRWQRVRRLRDSYRGVVHGREMRLAVSGAIVHIAMGRKANRDEHAMRSFELPAMGACLIAKATQEHYEIYGRSNEDVSYFRNVDDLVSTVMRLTQSPRDCELRGQRLRRMIVDGRNSYADRLPALLGLGGSTDESFKKHSD